MTIEAGDAENITIELEEIESSYLLQLLYAERERMQGLAEHAKAHGEVNPNPGRLSIVTRILVKLGA